MTSDHEIHLKRETEVGMHLQAEAPFINIPENKVHGANMGPTWVLSAPDGRHVGPMNFAIRDGLTGIRTVLEVPAWMSKYIPLF